MPPDSETKTERERESKRVSLSRSISKVKELVACNPWDYFVTITLKDTLWVRDNPVGLQSAIQAEAKRWTRLQVKGQRPYRDYKYLLIPDQHRDSSYHLHGFVHHIPPVIRGALNLIPYTLAGVESSTPLPKYICDGVRAGRPLYHCAEWDNLFGHNLLEPVRDSDRAANYATKYITKHMDSTRFATRFWHSRGLQSAKVVDRFILEHAPDAVAAYKDYMRPIAAVTSRGNTMQYDYHRPAATPYDSNTLAGVNTIIDRDTMSTSQVCAYLARQYRRWEEVADI